MTRMRASLVLVALGAPAAFVGGCTSSSPTTGDKPPLTTPAPAVSATPNPAPAPRAATGPITFATQPDDASCVAYRPKRGGVAVAVPKAIDLALACPTMPPVVLPSGDGFVYLTGHELRFWTQTPDPDRRLVLFDVKDDDQDFAVSIPVWSPDGTKLALVSKASSYPAKTRLFVLTISAAGAVTAKTKHDVAVFSPCGSVCVPQPPTWKDGATVEVTTDADGAPGAPRAFKL